MDQYESKHEEIPCGQLMHLALEVNYQIIEYRNNNKTRLHVYEKGPN